MGYRCFTIHFFFKIIGCKEYENEQGYITSELSFKRAVIFDYIDTEEKYIEQANKLRIDLSKQCKVPLENVILLTRDEYEKLSDEDTILKENIIERRDGDK